MAKRKSDALSSLSNAALAKRLDLSAAALERAVNAFNRIFEAKAGRQDRIVRLLTLTELPDVSDIGEKLAGQLVALGPIERAGRLATVEGMGPKRVRRVIAALAGAGAESGEDEPRGSRFLRLAALTLGKADAHYAAVAGIAGEPQAVIDATRGLFAGARAELTQLAEAFSSDLESLSILNEIISSSNADEIIASSLPKLDEDAFEVFGIKVSYGDLLSLITAILEKLISLIPNELIQKIAEDLLKLGTWLAEKLLKGEDPISKLAEEVAKIEKKFVNLQLGLLGSSPYRDADGTEVADPPSGEVPAPALKGSVLWFARDIENKLHQVLRALVGLTDFDTDENGAVVRPHGENIPDSLAGIIGELQRLVTYKIDTLAKLLSKTLVATDVEWDPEPPNPRRTITKPPNRTPDKAIKEELHDIEAQLERIIDLIERIIEEFGKPPKWPPEWPPEYPPIVVSPEIKRIFVYDEDRFSASAADAVKRIRVQTAAFDVGGWIDLTGLNDGDQVNISIFVHLPGPVRRLYRRVTYAGRADSGLKNLQEVTGALWVVGDKIDIEIEQPASRSGYPSALKIAYQFVVESQDLR